MREEKKQLKITRKTNDKYQLIMVCNANTRKMRKNDDFCKFVSKNLNILNLYYKAKIKCS